MIVAWNRIRLAALILLCLSSSAFTGEFKVNGRTFTLPEGFTIELIAGPPLVDRPIVADFDEQGRLYVADSSGSNEIVKKQVVERPHRIVRLEDKDGDGKFETRTIFADKMMFPEGAMWREGSLYVSAPPSIWKLTDTNNDGVADERVEWFQGKTLTGCANDLHGPYNGPDGWIYWCKGAFAEQTYPRPGKPPFVTRAAHIFRSRPDGSNIEPIMTGGMDNPVDVVFTPEGERIFTTTFLQNPGGGRRDGLIHAIYGGVYGKIHNVIDSHPQTGPDVMPVLAHLGPAAPCGLTRYESNIFGEEFRDNLFACQFNLRKVSRHILKPAGSALACEDREFLSSPDIDFHPTDVQEDADGSLIVVDTGGWYKLCCPTSQLEKPDILGAIYRIKKAGALTLADPRGKLLSSTKMTLEAWGQRLDDPRPAVRRLAIATLASHGEAAIEIIEPILKNAQSVERRRNAIWTLCRIDSRDARLLTLHALKDASPSVRATALHAISLWRDRKAVANLHSMIELATPTERRLIAEALGRIGDLSSIPRLLDMASAKDLDRSLAHAITYALIEVDAPVPVLAGLSRKDAGTRRVAMIALDQMKASNLEPEQVVMDLSSPSAESRQEASWIVGRHPEWAPALEAWFLDRLRAPSLNESDGQELESLLARFAKNPGIENIITNKLVEHSTPAATLKLVLKSMSGAGLKKVPDAWLSGLATLLGSERPETISLAVATTRALNPPASAAPRLTPRLLAVSARTSLPVAVRIEALAAAPGGLTSVPPATFAMLSEEVLPDRPVNSRQLAAQVLATSKLTTDQLVALTEIIAKAGPLEIDRLISAYEFASDERIGLSLIEAIKRSTARSALRPESIKPRLAKFGPKVQEQANTLYALLDTNVAAQKAQLDQLIASMPTGDIRRGHAIFSSAKAACITCHALGYVGGNIGPDLSRIGQIRTERDLLEAIVFPSASFVRSYEPMVIATKDGKAVNGLIRRESSDEIVLATGPNQEVRVARDDVEEIRPGSVSVMPAGLLSQLTNGDLADLVAFLKSRN